MPDINITRAILDELRQRYSKKPAPLCDECGDSMEYIGINLNLPMYGCTGSRVVDGVRVNKPGRSGVRDSHYHHSRKWIIDKHDKDVLALVDCFEHMHSEVLALADHIAAEAHQQEMERIKKIAGTWPEFMRVDLKGGENE